MFQIKQILNKSREADSSTHDGIPCYSPKNELEIARDKYEKVKSNIDFYTWLAYGNSSESSNIYFNIHNLVKQTIESDKEPLILEAGCGVGKTLFDISESHNGAHLVGFDYSLNMLKRAQQILKKGEKVKIDLADCGLPQFSLDAKVINKLDLIQGDVCDLPFVSNAFDVVINTFLIDRVEDVPRALEQMISVLKSGGIFIMTSPLNFQNTENWKYGNPKVITQLIKSLGVNNLIINDTLKHVEILDSRGNKKVWNTLMLSGRKK